MPIKMRVADDGVFEPHYVCHACSKPIEKEGNYFWRNHIPPHEKCGSPIDGEVYFVCHDCSWGWTEIHTGEWKWCFEKIVKLPAYLTTNLGREAMGKAIFAVIEKLRSPKPKPFTTRTAKVREIRVRRSEAEIKKQQTLSAISQVGKSKKFGLK